MESTIKNNACEDVKSASMYEIKKCVGRGNFGDVYNAVEKESGKVVAIKVINLEYSDENINLLAQEIFFLAEMRSPYITQYMTTIIDDVSMWIVMEYCGGGSCSDLIKYAFPDGLPESKVAFITHDILKGLKYLHDQKKIHRDIKAANILLTDDGLVKLGDFGVSGQIRATLKRGTFVGTPYWMAPEVINKDIGGYNESCDIWSLGITVYELLKGSPPFSRCDPMKVMLNVPKRKPPRLRGFYSDNAKQFIAACLIKEPLYRPKAGDLLNFPFVHNHGVADLKHEVAMLMVNKEQLQYRKKPKFPLNMKIYADPNETQLSMIEWNFESRRLLRKKQMSHLLKSNNPDTPLSASSNNESPLQPPLSDELKTPLTFPTTPSFRESNINNKNNINKDVSTNATKHDINMQGKETQELLKGFDYLKNVISFCFTRMKDRAANDSVKKHVELMQEYFVNTEDIVPGFAEVFVEEIFLRMDSIKNYHK